MKHITRRRADTEVRLGTWKVLILHRASLHPVSGSPLHQALTRQGHKIFPSTLHQALLGMQRNGLIRLQSRAARGRRDYGITQKGRQHLAALRKELSSAYDEVVRGVDPEHAARSGPASVATPGAHLGGLDDILTAVRNSERQRVAIRSALEQIQGIVADALT